MAKRILIVEDEKTLSRLVSLKLQERGYQVTISQAGQSGIDLAEEKGFELIFFDAKMLGQALEDQLAEIKAEKGLAILVMVDRSGLATLPRSIEQMADGVLVKPFAIEELLDIVDGVLSKKMPMKKRPSSPYRDLTLDEPNRAVIRRGESIPLTNREYALLSVLLKNRTNVMSREELLEIVWSHSDNMVETNVVDVYIRYIRGKLDIPGEESYIQTVRGRGYVIK